MNRESNRLVYAEGISLSNALRLSTEYQNIIFLTADNHISSVSDLDTYYSNSTGAYESNSEQPLGINIVRNGIKYTPIAGIHPLLNSFMIDGKKYELKIQKNTGLLCVVPYEISMRVIYIGKHPEQLSGQMLDGDDGFITNYESDINNIRPVTLYEKDNEYVKIYFPIYQNSYSYLIVYTSINILKEANIGHLDLLNMNLSNVSNDIVIYHTNSAGDIVLNQATIQKFINTENMDYVESIFNDDDNNNVYITISHEHFNNIDIINTLGQGSGNDEGNMTNTNLPTSFIIDKIHSGTEDINTVLYNIYKINTDDITGISIQVKNI